MEEIILISYLNDFIFCPVSIYFHKLYGNLNTVLYQNESQLNGTKAHETVDNKTYSTRKNILQGIDVFTEKYGILGKIDVYDINKKTLIERKNKVNKIYDGYVFQVYAQYFALKELGYDVKHIKIHSLKDNKNYKIRIPEKNLEMFQKFEELIFRIRNFDVESFEQNNYEKCKNCIYESACDRSKLC